jgi:hypothetical protein
MLGSLSCTRGPDPQLSSLPNRIIQFRQEKSFIQKYTIISCFVVICDYFRWQQPGIFGRIQQKCWFCRKFSSAVIYGMISLRGRWWLERVMHFHEFFNELNKLYS